MDGDNSARLQLPYLAAGQLQKHVTLNEALTRLDALVQLTVVSRTTAAQPASPADGDLYILPDGAEGSAWAALDAGSLVRAEANAWNVVDAPSGALAAVLDAAEVVVRDAGVWRPIGETIRSLQSLTRLGLNTGADAANPFAAKLNKALWTALEAAYGGDGDLRLTFNKEGPTDVLSLLFQSGYAGRAELGLIGDDNLGLKVADDGGTWRQALTVDRATGRAMFALGAARCETTDFHADATFSVPAWARTVEVLCVGGGGGGGSGAAGASGTNRYGGGGGGAGGASSSSWPALELTADLHITVGGGGTAATTVASGSGHAGGTGGDSAVTLASQILLSANGGKGGAGGSATAGTAGAGGLGAGPSNPGGDSSVSASAGAGGQVVRPDGPGGGGAGGGLATPNTARAGGAGGNGAMLGLVGAGGAGGSGAVGGAGGGAATPALSWPGGGGGGGGAMTSGAGKAGGAGALNGAGGGGGGAGVTASGAGGVGGQGLVRIRVLG